MPATILRAKSSKLNFWVSDNSGRAKVQTAVYFGNGRLEDRSPQYNVAANGKTYYWVKWLLRQPGRYRFCVRAWDARGNASAQSCAPLKVK